MTSQDLQPDDTRAIGTMADIVSAYVANNSLPAADLPSLIDSVHAAIVRLGQPDTATAPREPEVEKPSPAQIKKSITPDALISFIDGKPYKTLKRHLTTNGLSPDGYRAKYGLSSDYPMVSSSYSAARSEMAKRIGLGGGIRNAA